MLQNKEMIEQWSVFEIELKLDRKVENPFSDVNLQVRFKNGIDIITVDGFYDGDDLWRVRFMPEKTGRYVFITFSDAQEFDGVTGSFECVAPSAGNHGPVRVDKKYHFSYADGTPMFVMGTTAYAWTYMPQAMREKTLASFKKYDFNKIRMLFFPKYLAGFKEIDLTYEPPCLPYEGEKKNFDYHRFIVEYFKNFEERVVDLMKLGIEADVILFHNYDFGMWGIDDGMSDDDAIFYLKYLIARIAAYRNVWWSLANEYDLYKEPDGSGSRSKLDRRDWDRLANYIMEKDPYQHPRSIHNWGPLYPDKIWMTHFSYQFPNTYSLVIDLKLRYGKPVIDDEYQYEGNLSYEWGNVSGQEEVTRHWLSLMAGGYATHGECYVVDGNKKDIFWTYGGDMVSESAPRLKFFREIAMTLPYQEMEPDHAKGDGRNKFCLRKENDTCLYFITPECKERSIPFGERNFDKRNFDVTVYDVWNCKILQHSFEKAGTCDLNSYKGMVSVKVQVKK